MKQYETKQNKTKQGYRYGDGQADRHGQRQARTDTDRHGQTQIDADLTCASGSFSSSCLTHST
eukprot:352872-Chlamydomonas_euryale.AAC.3